MGIPKFFRWMSTKYPGLHVVAKPGQLPEIDNFYLDMNGIIHNCTHPCDGDVHFRLSEADMFQDIFNYLETLFRIINPKEFLFLAVDGVAPRAKMNQQRGRRFRSAKEACDREEAAIKKGDILPTEQRFDSNCITPGTEFMIKLSHALKEFIQRKLTTDRDWQRVKVVLSGHETPGEGEHKIMDFIRYQRSQPNYRPETSHCLYGLDTDLIMLGLSSHEPNFMLLREEIKFNRKNSDATRGKSQRVDPSRITFNVLYLNLLRDYLEKDFLPLKPKMRFKFDLESIIDDWILICFLVGNDFIPHIPHFHIHKDALAMIFNVYQEQLPKLEGYLNVRGILNLKRFKVFAKALAQLDIENYRSLIKENGGDCAKDDFTKLNTFVKHKLKITGIRENGGYHQRQPQQTNKPTHHSHYHRPGVWYDIQRGNKPNGSNYRPLHTAAFPQKSNPVPVSKPSNGNTTNNRVGVHSFTEEQINNSITVCADGDFIDLSDDEFSSDEKFPGEPRRGNKPSMNGISVRRSTPKKVRAEPNGVVKPKQKSNDQADFEAYKRTYYREKFKIKPDEESVSKVVHEYVRALQWNLHYYYHGCLSWGWFYPYHYGPFISDIVNFKHVDTKFELGEPFKPYDQLLSVLPAASSSLLPKIYRSLVTSVESPLAKFFPTEVEFDLNGKQNDWEAVVLAPFIDETALLNASVLCNLFLSEEERRRNNHGPHLMFFYVQGKSIRGKRAPNGHSLGFVKCVEIDMNGFHLPADKIKYGLLKREKTERA